MSSTPPEAQRAPVGTRPFVMVMPPVVTVEDVHLSTPVHNGGHGEAEERTPTSTEVPDFVLARLRGFNSASESAVCKGQTLSLRSSTPARVCLENRFRTISMETQRQQITVPNKFATALQYTEAEEGVQHLLSQKWMNPNTFEVIGHTPHTTNPNARPGLIPLTHTSSSTLMEKQHGPTSKPGSQRKDEAAAKSGCGGCRPLLTSSQRKERHNMKERERRKKIRWFCDELNMLVPFCDSDTDKVNTLRWTTTFLRYAINKHGETLKHEFQMLFRDKFSATASPTALTH